jgi:hypothetical protein
MAGWFEGEYFDYASAFFLEKQPGFQYAGIIANKRGASR